MSVSLLEVRKEAARRESEATETYRPSPTLPASAYTLTGAELARECESAVARHPLARSLKLKSTGERIGPVVYSKRKPRKSADDSALPAPRLTDEGSALAAMLAERVWRRMGESDPSRDALALMVERGWFPRCERGQARDVCRFMRRAEIALAAAVARPLPADEIPRSRVGREYLARELASLLSDSREWRDVAGSYRTQRDRQRDSGPMIESVDALPDPDVLTAAVARELEHRTGEPLPALPLDSERVTDAMAVALMVDGAPHDAVRVALRMAAGVPLASIARAEQRSLRTVAGRSASGAKWLRANVSPGELVSLMRLAADATGDIIPADERAPMLPASAAPAAQLIDLAKRSLRFQSGPLPGRVDGATSRDLRTIAGSMADRLTPVWVASDPLPHRADSAPLPAWTAWRALVARAERDGCDWPALTAARWQRERSY